MSIDALKARMPAYAKDIKLNISNVLQTGELTEQQVWGAALASAIATRSPEVIAAVAAEADRHLSPEATEAAKTAAAIMAMNNVYYRFSHLTGSDYLQMPARLRMNAIANPGVDKLDFELWSLAVSAVNGCGLCLKSHEKEVIAKGASKEAVQDAARIAAVIQAVATVLEAEDALAGEARAAA
ncbi:alkyl hydroperoxide reductase subunit D [Tistlia consotensis]|uniref:Alkyl hydroperoxide reductase AhpD n=1 Tax=Tistlia consotensis USBA 355 TaxID=560819 RepID=A0A1Y6CLK4_9PROT|nr:carboxymuconolactone decarboxylase family protein [Tistlia consotensis]SMF75687.1 alkyl hydroperoxide reductase subunit D [Tistlia consotensis USBA 355]SNS07548.1 alkyl hydroperoxide reductase subunit D [Tistlia consotensis]